MDRVFVAFGTAHHDQRRPAGRVGLGDRRRPRRRREPLPHQLGSVQARKTLSRGASKMRVSTRSWLAEGVDGVHDGLLADTDTSRTKDGGVPTGPESATQELQSRIHVFRPTAWRPTGSPASLSSRSRCMRICAASAGVLASAIARSKASRASSRRPSCISRPPLTPKK